MVVFVTKQERTFDPMNDGLYVARIFKVEEKKSEKHPEWRPQLQWTFEIVQPPYLKRRAWGRTPSTWFPGKTLDQWLTVMGVNNAVGTQLDLDSLVGTYVKVLVETKDNSDFPSATKIMALTAKDQEDLKGWLKEAETKATTITKVATAPVSTPAPAPVASTPAPAPVSTPAPAKSRPIPF